MPLPVINDTVRVSLNWEDQTNNLQATNVLHFETNGAPIGDVFTAIDSHVTANMWALQTSNVKVVSVSLIDLTTAFGASEEHPVTGAKWSGSGSTDYSPQTATIIKLKTGSRGRQARGRIYLPFTGETQQSHGTIQAVDAATVSTAWEAFRTAMATELFPLVVASYVGLVTREVSQCVCETLTGTQRRRQSQQR